MMEESKKSSDSSSMPLAIVGIGCMFPQAEDLGEYWANIKNGVDAITDIPETHWKPEDYLNEDPKAPDQTYAAKGGFLKPVEFNPLEFAIAPNDIEATDSTQLLGLVVAKQALQDAGYWPDSTFDRERVSVILGVTGTLELVIPLGARLGHPIWRKALRDAGVDDNVAEEVVQRISDSYVPWQENSFPGLLGNVVAGRIANRLDLGGTNCVVDAACASSLSALHLASLELTTGKSDMVITGGMDTFNDIFMYMCFSKTPALSPTGNAKPFDNNADGTILGEGLGALVLKRLEDAERDNDKIYAVVKGIGSSSDGRGNAIYAPCSIGQAHAIREAYRRADVSPETIELVEAHGTGTKVGDATEVTGLSNVFRETKSEGVWCAIGSVKSQIGHTKAGAGAAGIIKAALALHNNVLPPTIKVEEPLEIFSNGESPFYVNSVKRPWLPRDNHPRRAAVSSFGFGGSNFHCVLEEYLARKTEPDWDGDTQLLCFSADDIEGLKRGIEEFPTDQKWHEFRARAKQTRNSFSFQHACRLALVIQKDQIGLEKLLKNAVTAVDNNHGQKFWITPDGIVFGSGEAPGKLAFLFPGQGSQYVGMLRDFACQFPEMEEALAGANKVFSEGSDVHHGDRLSDIIYPHPAFTREQEQSDEKALRSTQIAQPAIGAVSLGAKQILESFGIMPDLTAGHSYGELTALCTSGVFDSETLISLSRLRGELMAAGKGDRGSMLAVKAPLETIDAVLAEVSLDLVIANKNAPDQAVLSGSTEEIEKAAELLTSREIHNIRLPVAAAFHSSLVADAEQPFLEALAGIDFAESTVPVFANTTAGEYPDSSEEKAELLAGQLARPVEFVQQITNMYEAGARTFIEVGPGARLTGLVKSILGGREFAAASIDASSGKHSGIEDLGRLIAQVAVLGHEVALSKWDKSFVAEPTDDKKPAMTLTLSGANYVAQRPYRPAAPSEGTAPKSTAKASVGNQIDVPFSSSAQTPSAPLVASRPIEKPMPPQPEQSPSPQASASPAGQAAFNEALRVTQENLLALQRLQEQTAQLHRQYLENQTQAQRTYQSLIDQQQQLLEATLGIKAPELPAASAPAAVPNYETAFASMPAPSAPPTPVTPQPIPETPQPAAPSSISTNTEYESTLLEIVAEKTGYPVEMLELDMELDSDLGVDSIKRVEILSAFQEKFPEIPEIKSEHLGDFHTLTNVLDFIGDASSDAPAPPPAAPATTAAPTLLSESEDSISSVLLQVVAEKTGYPVEMLDLDMELDSDLGIDSIKRVEILSELEEQISGLPEIKSEHLGDFQNLRQIVEFLASGSSGPEPAEAKPATAPAETSPSETEETGTVTPAPQHGLLRNELRSVPLNDEIDRESISMADGAEVWITDGDADLASAIADRLAESGCSVKVVSLDEITGAEKPELLDGLIIIAPPHEADDTFLKNTFKLMQLAGPGLRTRGKDGVAVLLTISRLDGEFGMNGMLPHHEPVSGGLAGLAKTAHHEWPEVHCKALDLAPDLDNTDEAARTIIDEMLRPLPIEVGISSLGRRVPELIPNPLQLEDASSPFEPGDVVVITGGARGITAEIGVALAKKFQPSLILLGRSKEPEPEPDWLSQLTSESEIKKAIITQSGGSLSPRDVGKQYQKAMANREMLRTFKRIEDTGASFIYRSVDVREAESVRNTIAEITESIGPVRGLIHGAGVLADRLIEDKTSQQFDLVYETKVTGLRNLLKAVAAEELKCLVLFSSSTARFGRTGQVDYAAANEVLNKIAQQLARLHPDCRVLSLNWGPWEGGMVTPSLRKVFEQEGVGLIPLEAGAQYLMEELQRQPGEPVEMVILGEGTGRDATAPATGSIGDPMSRNRPPIETSSLQSALEFVVDINRHPFLKSHVMNGSPVLPMAIIIEWLAHAAIHENPGLLFHGFDDLRVLKGVILDGDEPCSLQMLAGKAQKQDDLFLVPVELRSIDSNGRSELNARTRIVLTNRLPSEQPAITGLALEPYPHSVDEIYGGNFLFHGPDLHAIQSIEGCSGQGIGAQVSPAPPPSSWIENPLRSAWLSDPMSLDASFQLMILWSFEKYGAGSLPTFAARYRQFQRTYPKDGTRIMIEVKGNTNHRALANIEFLDLQGNLVARIEDYECVIDPTLNEAFRLNSLSEQAPSS